MDAFGLRAIIILTVASLFFSLMPLLLQMGFNNSTLALRVSSPCLGLSFLGFQIQGLILLRRRGLHVRRRGFAVTSNLIFLVTAVLLIMNAALWLSFAVYAWGVTWALISAAYQFVVITNVTAEELLPAAKGNSEASDHKTGTSVR